ncbi:vanadium-dependent haloperoxidase [Spirosoma luteum]|uniref:vanadium-dependent haloperoxidase n=1 Tax=Spirosoma luteum TaxID=431553 RepID=UPI000374E75C|nr:vanadium-dependent haloperoxidase [Spirosoma luteum]
MKNRRISAHEFRYHAADVAYNRPHPVQRSNGEESRYRISNEPVSTIDPTKPDIKNYPSYIAAFTKGFQHDENGFMAFPDKGFYSDFIRTCDAGDLSSIQALKLNERIPATSATPANPLNEWKSQIALSANGNDGADVRGWESMGAGLVYDLEGPDAQALTIPPAPTLDSDELVAEMIELYWMALCRDIPFKMFKGGPGSIAANNTKIHNALDDLNSLPWFDRTKTYGLHSYELARKRGYFKAVEDLERQKPGSLPFTYADIFRGNVKGDDVGPYVSQFLLVGNKALGISTDDLGNHTDSFTEDQGLIAYGSATIDQRVRIAKAKVDYMTTWEQWLDVQNAANLRKLEVYEPINNDNNVNREKGYRFISTPRDLCTYVHYDALHQAYFNACLILLDFAPFDPDLPFQLPDSADKQTGFAQFGPPHILNLVSEVATRALKAVRFQKYNVHRRVRPEVVGGWIHLYATNAGITTPGKPSVKKTLDVIKRMVTTFEGDPTTTPSTPAKAVWEAVKDYNATQNVLADRSADASASSDSYLLPMPYVEGSPMHPSYGSGHATVAGACVTILKAFFDEGFILPYAYEADSAGKNLVKIPDLEGKLTVENELNKLASNIAFARNWAGVHYWSDQAESLKLGEQIALGILEEQKLQYGENFSMTVPLFDGTSVRI